MNMCLLIYTISGETYLVKVLSKHQKQNFFDWKKSVFTKTIHKLNVHILYLCDLLFGKGVPISFGMSAYGDFYV